MAGHVRKLSSGRWQARFPKGGGRYRSKNFDRKADADRWLRSMADARDRGDWVDPRRGQTPLVEVAAEWLEMRGALAESTRMRDRRYLDSLILPTFGHMPIGRIATEDIEVWIRTLDRAPATVHKAFQILSGVLQRAVRTRRITTSPAVFAEGLPRIEADEMRFLTVPEVADLAEACGDYGRLVWAAALSGMRWAELVGLTFADVDHETRTATVHTTTVEVDGRLVSKAPKTSASKRRVAVPSRLLEVVGEGEGLVFVAPEGGPLRRSNFRRRVWEPAVAATVGPPMRFHDLRHTHAAWLIERGVHPKVICDRLGHSSIRVTMDRYGHLMDGLDGAAADSLDDMLDG